MSQIWLFKTEPETFSFQQLMAEKKTAWNGVRNFQARNFLKQVQVGDLALIYHSGKDKSIVGLARVIRAAYPDQDLTSESERSGDWVQVDIEPMKSFGKPIPLSVLKREKSLSGLLLLKQSRLSVMPVESKDYKVLLKLAES